MKSNFKQLFSRYYGKKTLDGGEIFTLDSVYDCAEDHVAKWQEKYKGRYFIQ